MRAWWSGLLLGTALVAASALGVFAQGRPEAEVASPSIERAMEQLGVALPSPDPSASVLPTAKVVRKGPASSGAVALTFDDGYGLGTCRSVANTLRRYDAVGTFFINGQWLRRQPEQWRRVLEGMEVGNHTRSHPFLTREPHAVVINQIRSNEWIHESALGRPMLKVLRPPYGAYGERVGRIAKQLGYDHIVMWNVDVGDWKPKATTRSIVRRAVGAPPGSIILMHCGRAATARAVPEIVRHYQARGIEVAGLSAVLEGARDVDDGGGSVTYGE